jgi:hypothetical protein
LRYSRIQCEGEHFGGPAQAEVPFWSSKYILDKVGLNEPEKTYFKDTEYKSHPSKTLVANMNTAHTTILYSGLPQDFNDSAQHTFGTQPTSILPLSLMVSEHTTPFEPFYDTANSGSPRRFCPSDLMNFF